MKKKIGFIILIIILLNGFSLKAKTMKKEIETFYTSGSKEIDALRMSMRTKPSQPHNMREQALLLHMWLGALQQQGADIRPFYGPNKDYINLQWQIERAADKKKKSLEQKMCRNVDQACTVLEEIQKDFTEKGPWFTAYQGTSKPSKKKNKKDIEWPTFQGNIHNTGYSEGRGPEKGSCSWKFPVGLGWYARPVIEKNRVYFSSPGMRTIAFCLDLDTGREIWRSTQVHEIFGIYKYPALASTPVIQKKTILIREMNSHGGDRGQAKHIVYIDKNTGKVVSRKYAGHLDYRVRYTPIAGNDSVVVYPFGVQDIYASPPVCQNLNRLICKDKNNEELIWDFNAGDIDILAQAVVTDTLALQGTEDGYLYAICLPGHPLYRRNWSGVMAWKFNVHAPVNTSVTVYKDSVIFGANNGFVYSIELKTGKLRWQKKIGRLETRARKHFSTAVVEKNTIYIGSADKHLYAIDLKNGKLLWSFKTSDWVRSAPFTVGGRIFVACIDGNIYAVSEKGKKIWEKKISSHPIYADLTGSNNKLLINDSNLYLYCIDTDGKTVWKKSILSAFQTKTGERIFTDQLSGGTFYQSKPVGYRDKLIFGTPSGFLIAADADTGREIWKFEMGAAISVGPACADGKIFAGQQGGEPHFYCVDAKTGKLIWKQALPGGWVWGSAKVDEGRVYIPTVSGYAVCLDAETGHMIWMYRTEKSIPAEPAIDNDYVYFGSWSRSLYAFDKKTGKIIWKTSGVGLDSGTLIAQDKKIYVPHHKNIFMSFDALTGKVLSRGNTNKKEKMNASNFNASPAFHKGYGFFSARVGVGLVGIPVHSRVYCVNLKTAKIKWTFPDGGGLSAPAIANGRVYIASGNSPFLYCLDEDTGKSCWIYKLGHRVEESTLCIYKGKVYALAADGSIRAVE